MAITVHKEKVFPSFAFAGAGLDLSHIQSEAAKGSQRAMQCSHLICNAEHETGPVISGGGAALSAQDQEPSYVGRTVLNIYFQHLEAVALGSKRTGDGSRIF